MSRACLSVGKSAVIGALLLWSAPLFGHPIGATIPSHQLALTVDGADVRVDYSVRLPTRWIMQEIGDRASFTPEDGVRFTAEKLDELAGGLKLMDGDAVVPLTLAPSAEPTGTGDDDFLVYTLALTGTLSDSDLHPLVLTQVNYPDEHSYFMVEALLSPGYRVTESSLFRIEDDRARFSVYGQWRMEEELREVSLTVSAPPTVLAEKARALSAPDDGAVVPATELVAVTDLEHLAGGRITQAAAAGFAAAFFLLGLAGVRGGPKRWWVWALGIGEALLVGVLAIQGFVVGGAMAAALALGPGVGAVSVWLGGEGRGVTAAALVGALGCALGGLFLIGV